MQRAALVTALSLGLSATFACGEDDLTFLGTTLDVVDSHLHTGTWDTIAPPQQEFLKEVLPFPIGLFPESVVNDILSAPAIVKQLDESGISRAVLFAVYAERSVGVTTNEFVAERIEEAPERFWGFASLDLVALSAAEDPMPLLDALEAAFDNEAMVGIKLAHPHAGVALDEERTYGVYELAGRLGVPVYVHAGNTPARNAIVDEEYSDAAFLEEAIARYPDTTFILGHVGYDFINKDLGQLETVLRLAADHDNVYLEASALGSSGSDPEGTNLPIVLRSIREAGLVDRLVYGSDGPQRPGFVKDYLARTLRALEKAEYSEQEAQAFLADNFLALIGRSL